MTTTDHGIVGSRCPQLGCLHSFDLHLGASERVRQTVAALVDTELGRQSKAAAERPWQVLRVGEV